MLTLFGQMEAGTLSWSNAVQGGVWADEVVEKDEHGNEVVGGSKRGKTLLSFVPSLELLVETLNEVIGNVIVGTLHTDMLDPMQRLNRHLVGKIAVAHNGPRSPHWLHSFQYGKSLWAVSMAVQMEAEHKAGFAVQNEPKVVFLALYLNDSFIGVPLVRVEIQRRNELYRNILEHWGKAGTPVANGCVRYPDVHYGTQNQSDIAERVLTQVEHGQGHEDHMNRIAHPLKICLSKEFGHGRS